MTGPQRPLSIHAATELLDIEQLASGEIPMPEIVAIVTRHIVARYPHGGNQLEAAIGEAILSGWRARHELQLIRAERKQVA